MFCQTSQSSSPSEKDTVKKISSYLFRYSDILGSGNFSTVYSGVDQNTGRQVAVKVVKVSSLKSKVALRLLESQISILKDLDHPNVIKCFDELTSVNNCYIITELCTGDLDMQFQKRGKFQEKQISKWIYDILKGLEYLERVGIVHRDLKISNIFLTGNGNAKIADFGFAIKAQQKFKDLSIGSPIYMSPQGLILNQYGPKTDVWSLGVMIYELLHGQCPLSQCKTEQQLKKRVLDPVNFRVKVSCELRKFIECCMKVNYAERLTVSQLLETPYAKRLKGEFQGTKIFKPYTSGYSSTYNSTGEISLTGSTSKKFQIVGQISYETAVSLLHYCRLIHKTCHKIKSEVMSQWLLKVSYELTRAKVAKNSSDKEQLDKLKEVIAEYHKKYQGEHKDIKTECQLGEVIQECEGLLQTNCLMNLQILNQENLLLKKSMDGKLDQFGKMSQSKTYLSGSPPCSSTSK